MKKYIVKTNLVEKEEIFKFLALSQASGLCALLIGVPGTAKTNIVLDFVKAQYDLTKPEEVERFNAEGFFILETDEGTKNSEVKGNVNIKKLVEENKFEIDSPITRAECIVINEVDKASSSLRNTFLGIMNEHVLFNGEKKVPCRWDAFIATCNSIPVDEINSPFWDRFILKHTVSRLNPSQLLSYHTNGGKKIVNEIEILIPDASDIESIMIPKAKLSAFIEATYQRTSDRTLSFVPDLVKYTKLIYGLTMNEALIKVCMFITDISTAQLLANNLNKVEEKILKDITNLANGDWKTQEVFEAEKKKIIRNIAAQYKNGELEDEAMAKFKQYISEAETSFLATLQSVSPKLADAVEIVTENESF